MFVRLLLRSVARRGGCDGEKEEERDSTSWAAFRFGVLHFCCWWGGGIRICANNHEMTSSSLCISPQQYHLQFLLQTLGYSVYCTANTGRQGRISGDRNKNARKIMHRWSQMRGSVHFANSSSDIRILNPLEMLAREKHHGKIRKE